MLNLVLGKERRGREIGALCVVGSTLQQREVILNYITKIEPNHGHHADGSWLSSSG